MKAGLKVTRQEWYARMGALSKLASQELWRSVERLGSFDKGQYLRVDYFKAPPGKAAAARRAAEAAIREKQLQGWHAEEIVLPAGSSHGYNTRTLTAFPTWSSLGAAGKLLDATPRTHELIKSELYQVVEVIRPK